MEHAFDRQTDRQKERKTDRADLGKSEEGREKSELVSKGQASSKQSSKSHSLFWVDPERIHWIDMAKAIAIILVVIGHTVKFGTLPRNFIFSFHMPLFFILSGYTMHLAANKTDLVKHLKKNVIHLLGPALAIAVISVFARWIMGEFSWESLWQLTKTMGKAYWWASGVNVRSHPGAGAVWFLFSLFWAKTIMDAVSVLFPGKKVGYIFAFIGIGGILLGTKGKWLPQNLDVTMTAILFLYLGIVWKEWKTYVQKYETILFLVAIGIWLYCLSFGLYIEMATRHYPYYATTIVEALSGTFAVCCLCKAIEANRKIRYVLSFIGMHTLLLFSVHCLDWIAGPVWSNHGMGTMIVLRTGIVLISGLVFYIIHSNITGSKMGNFDE